MPTRVTSNWIIVGLFALMAGLAFDASLATFTEQAREALTTPPIEPINVNQLLLRPFVLHVGMAALLVLPLVTARTFKGESRSAVSAFTAVMAVYATMLAASMLFVAIVFVYGSPEIGPVLSGYLGLLVMGAAFIATALLISSLTTSTVAAGIATYAVSLALIATAWLGRSGTPAAQPVFRAFSAGERLDDFAKGVIDTAPLATCAAIAAATLFLTMRALGLRASDR